MQSSPCRSSGRAAWIIIYLNFATTIQWATFNMQHHTYASIPATFKTAHIPPTHANSTDFPLAALHFCNFSSMTWGETEGSATTTTVFASTFVWTKFTPSILPSILLTAEAQPSLFVLFIGGTYVLYWCSAGTGHNEKHETWPIPEGGVTWYGMVCTEWKKKTGEIVRCRKRWWMREAAYQSRPKPKTRLPSHSNVKGRLWHDGRRAVWKMMHASSLVGIEGKGHLFLGKP